jgi:hypothetical protein
MAGTRSTSACCSKSWVSCARCVPPPRPSASVRCHRARSDHISPHRAMQHSTSSTRWGIRTPRTGCGRRCAILQSTRFHGKHWMCPYMCQAGDRQAPSEGQGRQGAGSLPHVGVFLT